MRVLAFNFCCLVTKQSPLDLSQCVFIGRLTGAARLEQEWALETQDLALN